MVSMLGGSRKAKQLWLPLFCWTLSSLSNRASAAAMGGIYTELPAGLDEVDVIIAGGL